MDQGPHWAKESGGKRHRKKGGSQSMTQEPMGPRCRRVLPPREIRLEESPLQLWVVPFEGSVRNIAMRWRGGSRANWVPLRVKNI